MEQTAIQPGSPAPKTASTAIQAGPPAPAAARPPESWPRYVLELAADLRVTVVLFVLALLLVFWGTLAQVDNGVWTVVQKYFRSLYVWVPLRVVFFNGPERSDLAIPFPGGWLIGGAMFINLLAAHAIRFKMTWARSGILLIHAGIIIMMVGELVTGLYAVEGSMIIKVGETGQYVVEPGKAELAVIRRLDAKKDLVVTVPAHLFREPSSIVDNEEVPFKVQVKEYFINSALYDLDRNPSKRNKNPATRGTGMHIVAERADEVSGVDPNQKHDQPSAYVKITSRKGEDLGAWLLSAGLEEQWINIDGVMYQIALRFKQTQRPYKLHLTKFTHDVYPGTSTPKDFHSYILLTDPDTGVENREIEIYMNNPLYFKGETFYQSSWTTDMNTNKANGTVLQVVRNPGWLLPYVSCAVVGFGMLIHFGLTLYRFVERRKIR